MAEIERTESEAGAGGRARDRRTTGGRRPSLARALSLAAAALALPALAVAAGGCLAKTVPEPTRYFRPALEEETPGATAKAANRRRR